jgi:hypothetical protein
MTRAVRNWKIATLFAALASVALLVALVLKGGELVTVKSALARGIPDTDPAAYWPLEGFVPSSGVSGGSPLTRSGQVQFSTQSGHPASAPLPDFTGGGSLSAKLPNTGTTNEWRYEFVARFGTGSDTVAEGDFTTPVRLESPNGTVNRWETLVSEGRAVLNYADTSGAFTGNLDSGIAVDDGQWHHIRIDAEQSGGNIVANITVDGIAATPTTIVGKTLDSTDSRIGINPSHEIAAYVGSVGHLAYWAPFASATDTYDIASGYDGEAATTRFARLCTENNVAYDVAS